MACGILVPQPEIYPKPSAGEAGVLTSGMSGKALRLTYFKSRGEGGEQQAKEG